jgi:hypothetical protein
MANVLRILTRAFDYSDVETSTTFSAKSLILFRTAPKTNCSSAIEKLYRISEIKAKLVFEAL